VVRHHVDFTSRRVQRHREILRCENASKVTVLSSELAVELQRRQQKDVSASPDVKMEDSGEDATEPVYNKAVEFASNAKAVSKFLEDQCPQERRPQFYKYQLLT
jgi:hypothetical protein